MATTTGAVEALRNVSILRGLSDAEIQQITEGSERKEFAAGAAIFKEGDEVTGLYMIDTGRVTVSKGGGAKQKELAKLDAKLVFGEMGLLVGGRARTATVTATEATVVYHLPRPRFAQLIEQGGPAIAKVTLNMARILAYRLDALNKEVVKLVDEAAKQGGEKAAKKTQEMEAFKEKLYKEWSF